jgi:hypothetical protein
MTVRPSRTLRRRVVERAEDRCEYCLIHQEYSASAHQIDHVVADKHGGPTILENLALSCALCNRRKGSDLSSIDAETCAVVGLFNPRRHSWDEHFVLRGPQIVGLSPEGRATVALLQLNTPERILERRELIRAGRYP